MELNYNIGAGDRPIKRWKNLDIGDDIELNGIRGVNRIYASHFIEYFDKVQLRILLQSWYDALKKDGVLQISVPDFAKIVQVYREEGVILDGPLYGKIGTGNKDEIRRVFYSIMENKVAVTPGKDTDLIYHKSVFDKVTLREALLLAGFRHVKEFESFHDDCSKDPISLNLQCQK